MLELIVSFALLAYAIVATFATVEAGKHPRALYFLFGAEMWERFSYYGMRALLVLYLVEHHGWQPHDSSTVYKWYTSLVYLTPLIGGFLADQFLGLRASIVIGGTLMALGHFLMAFEPIPIFYVALGCLILGNGFFKPNMSTLVGKMYKKDDARRDGAFTIFYMGINVGAGVAPIWCAAVREHFHSFHWGFALAGIGMMIGLVNFLVGQRTVSKAVADAGNDMRTMREIRREEAATKKTEEQVTGDDDDLKPGVGGVAGIISRAYPFVLPLLALAMPIYYAIRVAHGDDKPISLVMPIAFAIVFIVMGGLLRKLGGAAKDKSIVIFVVFVFVVLFWMAFEQAGNALNLWAEFFTDRHIGSSSYTAESFQSANPIFILLFAPAFSALWLWMAKRGFEPRTSVKILVAMVFMAASFAIMVVGAARENAVVTRVDKPFTVPKELAGKELDAGRLTLKDGSIEVRGVLAHYVVQDMFEKVAPQGWVDWAKGLDDTTKNATAASPVTLPVTAATFKMPFDDKAAKEAGVTLAANELVFTKHADAQVRAAIAAAAAPPEFREAVSEAENESLTARNTGLWLLLSYLFATLGELCLSPVGLSMVTKLAPRRFASLFMGVWLLTSSVAQYAGGSIGESWGAITPMSYFWLFVWTSLAGAVVLVLLVKPLNKLMHEVH
ncbi:MAG TPA: peptide MFS transporter [Polyangiaceae bacterium]|nr:peptide MFS transporter [Polyangiaceae bacterium]